MADTLLIYGSLTGNTEGVAYKVQELCRAQGKEIEIKNSADANTTDLTGPHHTLVLACSTWDDGLPQADFADFIERVKTDSPQLASKKIAILGCGDRNYVHFCGATQIIEKTFIEEMGGVKILDTLHIDGYPETEENQAAVKDWTEKLAALLD